jgi:hypothetical protein
MMLCMHAHSPSSLSRAAGFQWSWRPNMVFPSLFTKAGYKTSGYGKIFHWDGNDKEIWNHEGAGTSTKAQRPPG